MNQYAQSDGVLIEGSSILESLHLTSTTLRWYSHLLATSHSFSGLLVAQNDQFRLSQTHKTCNMVVDQLTSHETLNTRLFTPSTISYPQCQYIAAKHNAPRSLTTRGEELYLFNGYEENMSDAPDSFVPCKRAGQSSWCQ